MTKHYVKIELTDLEIIGPVHIAELEELDPRTCTVVRLLEQQAGQFTGFIDHGQVHGDPAVPLDTVPHPDLYASFEDITATRLTAEEFELLWGKATS